MALKTIATSLWTRVRNARKGISYQPYGQDV
jgi:hypothetical protein